MVTMTVVMMMIMTVKSQRRVVGDIREQSISQLADFDAREERVFRCVDIGLNFHMTFKTISEELRVELSKLVYCKLTLTKYTDSGKQFKIQKSRFYYLTHLKF